MDFSRVKYIFQIPLEWFRAVDTRVFGDHPGHGMKTEGANDGSKAWSVDVNGIMQEIQAGLSSSSGVSASYEVVSSVSWDGAVLAMTKQTWTFSNGLLTSVSAGTQQTIDTPVAVDITS